MATATNIPTATPTPVLINQGKPCLQLTGMSCGAAGQQTVNLQTDKTIAIAGWNWKSPTPVNIYLVKGTGACPHTPDTKPIHASPDNSGFINELLPIPADAKAGDTYRVCAQQGKNAPVPAVLLTIHISQPSQASTNLFDTYSAAALLLLLISVLAGVPELLRMTGPQAGR
jgi:hypothetical protein